jgi:hypothetical protein
MSRSQFQPKTIMEMRRYASLRQGRLQHKTIPPDVLEEIKGIFDVVRPYFGGTLEQFEVGFMYDLHLASEVGLWRQYAAAFVDYINKHLGGAAPDAQAGKALLGALVMISWGVTDAADLNLPIQEARSLIQCYDALRRQAKQTRRNKGLARLG